MDRALVERARDGDHDAFESLAAASSGRLYAVASLILRDQDRAKDAVQEALIAAWRGIRALREPEAWDAWSYRLVVRASYRLVRRERRGTVLEIHVVGEDEPSIDDGWVHVADRDELARGFRHLTAEQRAILVLHYYVGLPLTEAADVLGLPHGTVKSRLHRALVTMRTTLDARVPDHVATQERPA
ncbi:MAG TPA: sigma-70 family RNA polymerase sigma factor [Candidatus Limnocylindrales bacterium]|nr:sigma-70 family RNA polymerase sigma factor [Candidatus Limnocylindrales bacterium]